MGRHGLQLGARTRRGITLSARPASGSIPMHCPRTALGDLALRAGADVVLSNHTKYDLRRASSRSSRSDPEAAPTPCVIGKENVQRFFTIAAECGKAGVATTPAL